MTSSTPSPNDGSPIDNINSNPAPKTHHRADKSGFKNIWPNMARQKITAGQAFQFLFKKAITFNYPHVPVYQTQPEDFITADQQRQNAQNPKESKTRVFWLGHSTVLIQSGINIITDPVFCARVSPLKSMGPKRLSRLPLALKGLPKIDLILLSHNHYDHLDKQAMAFIVERDNPLVYVPLGVEKNLKAMGIKARTVVLDWHENDATLSGYPVYCLPARHFSGRGISDRDQTLWCSWLIKLNNGKQIYFGGDSAYAPFYKEIGNKFPSIDLNLMPIGAYLPSEMMRPVHVNPEEALAAHIDLKAKEMLPIHWATYDLAAEGLLQPMEDLELALKKLNADPSSIWRIEIGAYRDL